MKNHIKTIIILFLLLIMLAVKDLHNQFDNYTQIHIPVLTYTHNNSHLLLTNHQNDKKRI